MPADQWAFTRSTAASGTKRTYDVRQSGEKQLGYVPIFDPKDAGHREEKLPANQGCNGKILQL
jgi:hypothetical protein